MTLRTLNYGNYGIVLKMGNAGFCPSTVGLGYRGALQDAAEQVGRLTCAIYGACIPRIGFTV